MAAQKASGVGLWAARISCNNLPDSTSQMRNSVPPLSDSRRLPSGEKQSPPLMIETLESRGLVMTMQLRTSGRSPGHFP